MPRGRKEGSVSGKRSIFWVCASFTDKLIMEKIYSPSSASEDDIKSFTSDEASKIFKKNHGIEPINIIGPCYDVKSMIKSEKVYKSASTINSLDPSKTNISTFLGTGSYNGWKGTIFGIAGKNDEVLFIASERLDSNINKTLPMVTPIKKELIIFQNS